MQELADIVAELVQPSRIDIVRAKRLVLQELADGLTHSAGELLETVATMLQTEPFTRAQVDLPDRESIREVVTADHPAVKSLRADCVAREALAELNAAGMLIPAGAPEHAPDPNVSVGYSVPGYGASVNASVPRPAILSSAVWLPHRLRQPGVWRIEADVFVSDLDSLELDPRTGRSLREAMEAYRRGLFLAAASLLGATVEGAWFAAGQRLTTRSADIDKLVDSDRTAQLQAAVATHIEQHIQKTQRWKAKKLSTFAALMRSVRNYGVHPRGVADDDVEAYFEEDTCGLLFLNVREHVLELAAFADHILTAAEEPWT